MEKRVLVSVTTVHRRSAEDAWKPMLREIQEYGVREFALFLTGLDAAKRKSCFSTLKKLRRWQEISIPFVHARSDMSGDEYRLLMAEYGTQAFNLHRARQFPHSSDLDDELRRRIFIENAGPLDSSDLQGFAGICLDLSHLEDCRLTNNVQYAQMVKLLESFPIGANHISAIRRKPRLDPEEKVLSYADHRLSRAAGIDYLLSCPARYFAPLIAIELSNPIAQQLALKARIESQVLAEKADALMAA